MLRAQAGSQLVAERRPRAAFARNRHRGHTDHDAGETDPGGCRQALAEQKYAKRDANRHTQVSLAVVPTEPASGSAEIDHEGKRGRKYREREQRQHQWWMAPGPGRSTAIQTAEGSPPQRSEPAAGAIGSRPLNSWRPALQPGEQLVAQVAILATSCYAGLQAWRPSSKVLIRWRRPRVRSFVARRSSPVCIRSNGLTLAPSTSSMLALLALAVFSTALPS